MKIPLEKCPDLVVQNTMPPLQGKNEDTNAWDEWLNQYLILNDEKMLLAELRDAIPLCTPEWITQKTDDNWRWSIQESDFVDHLIRGNGNNLWLNIEGSWSHYNDGKCEDVSFSSILVPKGLGISLLRTVDNFSNHHNEVYLYNFCESDYSDIKGDFSGKEWLVSQEGNNELESKNPFSGTIEHNPLTVAKCISDDISVTYSHNQKHCILISDNSLCLRNIYWSEDKPEDTDTYISSGKPVQSSLKFLRLICNKLGVNIAIQVNISRTQKHSYSNRNSDDELGYVPGYSKTFILSGDGKLRDSRKSYRLGQDDAE